jgi:hypothetical protein
MEDENKLGNCFTALLQMLGTHATVQVHAWRKTCTSKAYVDDKTQKPRRLPSTTYMVPLLDAATANFLSLYIYYFFRGAGRPTSLCRSAKRERDCSK